MQSFPAVYRAIVTAANDPERRGRVEVMVPAVTGDATAWALVVHAQHASSPVPGDEVVVAFEGGDTRIPIVLGSLWKGSSLPGAPRHS
jgi:uncharacterized protein involved in type VI secretion and phage assembly